MLHTQMISFLDILKSKNEPMYYCGWVCLVGAIICYILTIRKKKGKSGIDYLINYADLFNLNPSFSQSGFDFLLLLL